MPYDPNQPLSAGLMPVQRVDQGFQAVDGMAPPPQDTGMRWAAQPGTDPNPGNIMAQAQVLLKRGAISPEQFQLIMARYGQGSPPQQ